MYLDMMNLTQKSLMLIHNNDSNLFIDFNFLNLLNFQI